MKNSYEGACVYFWDTQFAHPHTEKPITKNQYVGGNCLKGGVWTVGRFKGGGWRKRGGGVLCDKVIH